MSYSADESGKSSPLPLNGGPISGVNGILLDNIQVRVETYLGETSMTVAALNALQANGVVTLDAGLNSPIELRVNGVTIAYGELVAVGDKFGVRVTSVAP